MVRTWICIRLWLQRAPDGQCPCLTQAPLGVEVEYVSAPREYEMFQQSADAEAAAEQPAPAGAYLGAVTQLRLANPAYEVFARSERMSSHLRKHGRS